MKTLFILILFYFLIQSSLSECPNACTGHGKCEEYDACKCYKSWMGNDCSESNTLIL